MTLKQIEEITPENLRPFSKNPTICKFMIQLGRFDELGSGVTNINKYLPRYAKGAKPVFKETLHGFELIIPLATRQEPQQVTTKNPASNPASGRTVKSADSRYVAGGIDGCPGTERPSEFLADLCRARAFRRVD